MARRESEFVAWAAVPPYREDARYGALTNNSSGNDAFHKDRAVWYEHVTGDSLDGLSLAEQRERVDVIARRFRVYNDGRAPRPRAHMPPNDTRDSC